MPRSSAATENPFSLVVTTSRRRLLRRAALGGLALLAACRPSAPNTPPPEATSTAQPVPSATTAPTAPSATPEASATSAPSPTGTPTNRLWVPAIPNQRAPTAVPPTPVPTATPVPATSTPRPTGPSPTPGPTETPRPTPPPGPTAGPKVPITKITKWGLGVYMEGNEIFESLYVAKPTVLLLMDPSPGWAQRIRQWFPKAFIVGRRFRNEVSQPLDNPGARGAAFADAVAEHAVPLKGVVDAWVSYNEVVGKNAYEDYKRYNEFQVAFAHRLQDVHGVAAVAGNDGSGAVDPPDYAKYFGDAIKASRYFGVHAYSPLGSHSMREAAEWNTLRYRKIHDELEKAGIKDVQMVITESGLGDGWLNRVDDVSLVQDFFWFTDELEKDPYMKGHAAYGVFDNDQKWKAFDLRATDVLTRMGYYEPPSRRAAG